MNRKLTGLAILCMCMTSACTTISSVGLGANRVELAAEGQEQARAGTTIRNLADGFVQMFQSRGWTNTADDGESSRKLVGLLSRGLSALKSDKPKTDPYLDYIQEAKARNNTDNAQAAILADIDLAARETRTLQQQVNAIETASVTPGKLDARSLEQAVLCAHKARRLFAGAAQKNDLLTEDVQAALQRFEIKITELSQQASQMSDLQTAPAVG